MVVVVVEAVLVVKVVAVVLVSGVKSSSGACAYSSRNGSNIMGSKSKCGTVEAAVTL